MKKFFILTLCLITFFVASKAEAQYYTFGLGPAGTIFVVDSNPELGLGVGGYLFFDYRWSPQLSTQVSILVTTQDGKGITGTENGIEMLGIPTFDIKYYFVSNVSRWDPYAMVGVGFYAITEGTIPNGTPAFGVGANIGIGTDYYLNDKWSIGLTATFRSLGLIDSVHGSNNGIAEFPVILMGNAAYHF